MDTPPPRTPALSKQAADARLRRLAAAHLQAVEGNPLDAEDIALFEMFEREGWSHERRAFILAGAARLAAE